MTTRTILRLVCAASAAIACSLLGTPTVAAAAVDREAIFAQLHVNEVPADYVVLVDTSYSMTTDNLYGQVKETLRAFLDGLDPVDHVALYTFDNKPKLQYVGSARDADEITEALPPAPTPGGKTDIGAAIAEALHELERPKPAKVASVVLITDGKHEPPSDTAYPGQDGAPWTALAGRATALNRPVHGYALSLNGATGAALLGTVVKPTTELDPKSIGELREYLDRAKDGTRAAKAKLALAADIGKGVEASWQLPANIDAAGGPVPVTLTLRSQTAVVPLTVTGLRVAAHSDVTLTGEVPTSVDLKPKQSVSYKLTVDWRPEAWVIPFHAERRLDTALAVTGQVSSPWTDPLKADFDLKVPPKIVGGDADLRMNAEVGTWAAQIAVGLAAVLLALLVVILVYRARRLPQSGVLVATASNGTELDRVRLRGRSTRVRGDWLPVTATVVARPAARDFTNMEGARYELRYRQDGRRRRSVVGTGNTVLVHGVLFERLQDATAQPTQVAPTAAERR